MNREQCRPPLDRASSSEADRRRASSGRASIRPRPRSAAREGAPASSTSAAPGRRARGGDAASRAERAALFLPFTDVQLTGPPRWLWRGKVPEGAVTLLAGRPKLGKSLLAIWLAAQLSRGLLEGAYHEIRRGR